MCLLGFCHLANAEQITISTADNYPYKNLVNRTNAINIFYTTDNGNHRCRVEITLKKMKWLSPEKQVNKEAFNDDILSNCLSKETAEKILHQTFLQFGQGL